MKSIFMPAGLALLIALAVAGDGYGQPASERVMISGSVVDAETGEGIGGAHVFLAKSMLGAVTDRAGAFKIENFSGGGFVLVVSMLGYETEERVLEASRDVEGLRIVLSSTAYELEGIEVAASEDRRWQRQYETFASFFLGESERADSCAVLNSHVLDFSEDASGRLSATASGPVVIENRSLGYRVTFVLREFTFDAQTGIVRYLGEPFFEPLEARSADEDAYWSAQREEAYLGSLPHLISALIDDRTFEEGFLLYDTHSEKPLRGRNVISPGALSNQYDLVMSGPVRVVYKRTVRRKGRGRLFRTRTVEEASTLEVNASRGVVQKDGYYRPAHLFTAYGAMSERRMADALPGEYGILRQEGPR